MAKLREPQALSKYLPPNSIVAPFTIEIDNVLFDECRGDQGPGVVEDLRRDQCKIWHLRSSGRAK